jgi:hypothetical protein
MWKLSAATVAMTVALSLSAFAQTPIVDYCKALQGRYRQAVTNGKPVQPGAGEAGANCPTNPAPSIPILETALKEMKVDLPRRP